MSERIEALIRPELLVWARETAGYSVEQAAKKLAVRPEQVEAWERGERRPTIVQLRKAANAYKRPFAAFYLSAPPLEGPPLHDFRRLPGQVSGVRSPNLRFEIRRAQTRREAALELYEALGTSPQILSAVADLTQDTEELGATIRRAIGVRYEDQFGWSSPYESLGAWRTAVENAGVLVFQMTTVPLDEARGFSIAEKRLPAVVLNTKDTPRGRTFTLLHEFVHLLLQMSGLCDAVEETERAPEDQRVEVFCNAVAGAALVPRGRLLTDDLVQQKPARSAWQDEEIEQLVRRYSVSREVIVRRLLRFDRITQRFYEDKIQQYQREYEEQPKRTEGFAPPHQMAISSAGPLFTRLVLLNYHQENLTGNEVSSLLGVRLQHLPKIEAAILGRRVTAEAEA